MVDIPKLAKLGGLDDYEGNRSRIGDYPHVLGMLPVGILPEEITTPGDGQIRAMLVSAGNPVLSAPNGDAIAAAWAELETSVGIDFYMSETAALCEYFLPTTTFFEREDFPLAHANLMSSPYAQWTEAVIPPVGEARPEWEIFVDLSDAMGLPVLNQPVIDGVRKVAKMLGRDYSPRVVMDAAFRAGPYGDKFLPWSDGLSIGKIAAQPHGVLLGPLRTGILGEKMLTPDKRIHLWGDYIAGEMKRFEGETAKAPSAEFPFALIGRRDVRSHNSWMHNTPHMMRGDRCRRLRMHPDDAGRLGLTDGERVRVRSDLGALEVELRVTDELMPGVVSLPHGWGHDKVKTNRKLATGDPGPNCNDLIDHRVIEPLAGMCFLNGYPVAVERADAPAAASA